MRLLMLFLVMLGGAARAQEAPQHTPHDPFALYGDSLQFDVYRKGARIGQYQATFSRRDTALGVPAPRSERLMVRSSIEQTFF